jgi:hypothetical protein
MQQSLSTKRRVAVPSYHFAGRTKEVRISRYHARPRRIPNLRGDPFAREMGCFAPQLTAMLAFTFAAHRSTRRNHRPTAVRKPDPEESWAGALAIVLSLLRVATFVSFFAQFAAGKSTAREVIGQIDLVQPAIAFTTTGMLGHYFGSK